MDIFVHETPRTGPAYGLSQVRKALNWHSEHERWFAEKITALQNGEEFNKPEPILKDYIDSDPSVPTFVDWCAEVSNTVGPALMLEDGHLRLKMDLGMEALYKKYVLRGREEPTD